MASKLGQVLGEQLVDRERDEGQLVGRRAHVVGLGPQDEEGDDVGRRVALDPLAEGAYVVGRAPRDVQDAHALASDIEGQKAPVVLGDGVPCRRGDGDFDDPRPRALERNREIEDGFAIFDVRDTRSQYD